MLVMFFQSGAASKFYAWVPEVAHCFGQACKAGISGPCGKLNPCGHTPFGHVLRGADGLTLLKPQALFRSTVIRSRSRVIAKKATQ